MALEGALAPELKGYESTLGHGSFDGGLLCSSYTSHAPLWLQKSSFQPSPFPSQALLSFLFIHRLSHVYVLTSDPGLRDQAIFLMTRPPGHLHT